MNNKITPLPNGDFKVEELAEVGKWMDEDKGYQESTLEKQQEWAMNRNYHYTNTDNPIDFPKCWCHTCSPITLDNMRMILCPDCGNKRCPKANHHDNPCTNSNDTGQTGSAYQ